MFPDVPPCVPSARRAGPAHPRQAHADARHTVGHGAEARPRAKAGRERRDSLARRKAPSNKDGDDTAPGDQEVMVPLPRRVEPPHERPVDALGPHRRLGRARDARGRHRERAAPGELGLRRRRAVVACVRSG